jgi:hypothetical protein
MKMPQNTPNAVRIEHDKALARVTLMLFEDDTKVYKMLLKRLTTPCRLPESKDR